METISIVMSDGQLFDWVYKQVVLCRFCKIVATKCLTDGELFSTCSTSFHLTATKAQQLFSRKALVLNTTKRLSFGLQYCIRYVYKDIGPLPYQ